jgi:lipopolysaccharide transport system permease protein
VSLAPGPEVLLIESGDDEPRYWRDLWDYRELFLVLAWRDVAVRYKQTLIGVAWAVLRPILTMVVFTVIFGRIAQLPSEGNAPYALMVFAGLLPWQFFSAALTDASSSVIGNAALIGKVYFPRLIVPTAAVVVSFLDFLVSLGILAALMIGYRYPPGWQLLTLPAFGALAFLASLGPGLWLASLNVRYRDFRYVVPFLVQLGLFVSPVAFSSGIVPERWRLLYSLNPMVGVIDGFRWAILGGRAHLDLAGFAISCAVILVLLWIGIRRFRRAESLFADQV